MTKYLLCGIAALALSSTPAMAAPGDTSGTVNVSGSVAAKCTAQNSPFSSTINLGELALSTGKVDSAFSGHIDPLTRSFTIVCTSPNPSITVSSTKLTNTTDATTGDGYTGTIDYTSTLVADKASGSPTTATATYNTTDAGPATAPLGARFANATNNLRVTVSNGSTANNTDLLKAGDYTSIISITVSPS